MTLADRWQAIGETLQMTGEMPPFDEDDVCWGLCAVLWLAFDDGWLTEDELHGMEKQLTEFRSRLTEGNGIYFWPTGQVAPRIEACFKIAKWLREE